MQDVSQEPGCFIIQVMTGCHHVVVLLNSHAVELIALHGPAGGAGRSMDQRRQFPNAGALLLFHRMNVEFRLIGGSHGVGETLDLLLGPERVITNTQVDV